MGQVITRIVVDAPPEVVFDYVGDYRTATRYSKDLRKWEPVSETTDEVGAQFDTAMQLGPKSFEARVEIDSRVRPEQFGWTSISGFQNSGHYTFEASGTPASPQTTVSFVFEYTLPGGMAGRLLARTTEPLLKSSLNNNLKTLKQQVEQLVRDEN